MKVIYTLFFFLLASFYGFGQASLGVLSSSPSSNAVKLVKFYPNPAITQITFDFEQGYDKTYSFQIYNFTGKKMFELFAITPKSIINIADFYRGVYIYQLKDRNGRVIDSGKFQVAH
jgi:hypothetical protein